MPRSEQLLSGSLSPRRASLLKQSKDFIYATAAGMIEYADQLPSDDTIRKAGARSRVINNGAVFTVGPLEMNADTRIIRHDGVVLMLEPREVSLLIFLGRCADQLVPREKLIWDVWGHSPEVHGHAIDTAVSGIRRVLSGRGLGWMIEVVRGRGVVLRGG